jgi:hypothetical protein
MRHMVRVRARCMACWTCKGMSLISGSGHGQGWWGLQVVDLAFGIVFGYSA